MRGELTFVPEKRHACTSSCNVQILNILTPTLGKGARDLYELFQIRDKLFRGAYQHKTKRAIEHM